MKTLSRTMKVRAVGASAALALAATLSACGGAAPADPDANPLARGATIDAPSDPGSGYDQTARAIEKGLTAGDLAGRVQVTTSPGAGGTVALSQFVQGSDASDLMVVGQSLVGAVITNNAKNKLSDTTPIARLIGEYEVIVVPTDSKYKTLEEFLTGVAEKPGANPIAIGNQGGVDHMWGGVLVQEAGVKPTDVNFVTFDGGGEVVTALLGSKVAAGISGYNEFAQQIESGDLRVLAVSSDEPLEIAPDAPTVSDAGYPDAVFVNWRGIVAPPGISKADRTTLSDTFEKLNDTKEWADLRKQNGWSDEFLDSDAFTKELATQETEAQTLLSKLGLA